MSAANSSLRDQINELAGKITGLIHPASLVKVDLDPEDPRWEEVINRLPEDPYGQDVIVYALLEVLARHVATTNDPYKTLRHVTKLLRERVMYAAEMIDGATEATDE